MFDIYLTDAAKNQLERLKKDKGLGKRYHAIKKAIHFLSENPRHKSLQTHEFTQSHRTEGRKNLRSLCGAIHSCRLQNILVLWSGQKTDYDYCRHPASLGIQGLPLTWDKN